MVLEKLPATMQVEMLLMAYSQKVLEMPSVTSLKDFVIKSATLLEKGEITEEAFSIRYTYLMAMLEIVRSVVEP